MITKRQEYPLSTRVTSTVFRNGLLGLSLFCSAFLISGNLNNQGAKLDSQIAAINDQAKQQLAQLEQESSKKLAQHRQNQMQELQRLSEMIDKQDGLRTKELSNFRNGENKGKRYDGYNGQFTELSNEYEAVRQRQPKEALQFSKDLARLQKELTTSIEVQRNLAIQAAKRNFDPDARENNDKQLMAFIDALTSLAPPWVPKPSQLIFLFALTLSLLIEAGLILAFEHAILTLAPLLHLQIQGELEQEMMKTRIHSGQEKDGIRHETELDSIRRKARQTVDKARSYVEDGILNARTPIGSL